jgi:hypothetical protein
MAYADKRRRLFLIEGVLTIATGIAAIFILPNYPATTSWFSPADRDLLAGRVLADKLGHATRNERKLTAIEALKAALSDYRTYFCE